MKTTPKYLSATAATLILAALSGTAFSETRPVHFAYSAQAQMLARPEAGPQTRHSYCWCKKCKGCRCRKSGACWSWR